MPWVESSLGSDEFFPWEESTPNKCNPYCGNSKKKSSINEQRADNWLLGRSSTKVMGLPGSTRRQEKKSCTRRSMPDSNLSIDPIHSPMISMSYRGWFDMRNHSYARILDRFLRWFVWPVLLVSLEAGHSRGQTQNRGDNDSAFVQTFLGQYCLSCHSGDSPEGNVAFPSSPIQSRWIISPCGKRCWHE